MSEQRTRDTRSTDKVATATEAEGLLLYAKRLYLAYEAFQQAGFTDDQAFTLTRMFMRISSGDREPAGGGQYL